MAIEQFWDQVAQGQAPLQLDSSALPCCALLLSGLVCSTWFASLFSTETSSVFQLSQVDAVFIVRWKG